MNDQPLGVLIQKPSELVRLELHDRTRGFDRVRDRCRGGGRRACSCSAHYDRPPNAYPPCFSAFASRQMNPHPPPSSLTASISSL